MAIIQPFICVRPTKENAAKVAALPYDVYTTSEARKKIEKEPLSFLKIDRAETCFDENINPYDEKVYSKAAELLHAYKEKKILIKDTLAAYYIYQLEMNQRVQTGIVACASIDDYINHVIKTHENTRSEKEQDRVRHVEVCQAQTGPIFLAYRSNEIINTEVEMACKEEPIYNFVAEDEVRHTVWKINDQNRTKRIKEQFEQMDSIYIADGHHRAKAAVNVGVKRRKEKLDTKESDYFLSVLFPDDQLMIMPYNRCVTDLNGYSAEEFLGKVEEKFRVTKRGKIPYGPERKGKFGMFLENSWYELELREEANHMKDAVSKLDVSILHEYLIQPILGITHPKTDSRIDFIGGIRGLEELEYRVQKDMKVAFSMYATSIGEVFEVSDEGKLMPPKSTWFEPKLRSGLFIHEI